MTHKDKRKLAYKNSSLPYSFEYKIKRLFWGKDCPICSSKMQCGEFGTTLSIPTIQHNDPISCGGKHELENISIICKSCNVSIRNKITGKLNNEIVTKEWYGMV